MRNQKIKWNMFCNQNGYGIACDKGKIFDTGRFDYETKSKVRLIAAAPELLEALEAAEEAFGNNCDDGGYCSVTVKMRKAIAKAKGESQ